MLIFAILGLNLFSGKFWACTEFRDLSRVECEAARVRAKPWVPPSSWHTRSDWSSLWGRGYDGGADCVHQFVRIQIECDAFWTDRNTTHADISDANWESIGWSQDWSAIDCGGCAHAAHSTVLTACLDPAARTAECVQL